MGCQTPDLCVGCHYLYTTAQSKMDYPPRSFFYFFRILKHRKNSGALLSMIHLSEHTHLKRLQAGSTESFQQLYQWHHHKIYHYCLKFLVQPSLAEEATADVFIKLWEKRQLIDPAQRISPFLFKLAKDISYNYLRKIASDQRLQEAYLQHYPGREKRDGEQVLIEQEERERLLQLIDLLPPKRREIFRLRYEEELNYASIAKQLGISSNTVKVQLVKARKFLKHQLTDISMILLGWIGWF